MKRILSLLLTLVLLASFSTACKPKQVTTNPTPAPVTQQGADTLREIDVYIDRVAVAYDETTELKRSLYRRGFITKEQSASFTAKLLTFGRILDSLDNMTAKYDKFDVTAKEDLLRAFGDLAEQVKTLNELNLLVKDEAMKRSVNTVLSALQLAVGGLQVFLNRPAEGV